MTRVVRWKTIMDRFKKILSNLKVVILFIGGRSMLLKSVLGSLGIYILGHFSLCLLLWLRIRKHLEISLFRGEDGNNRKMA